MTKPTKRCGDFSLVNAGMPFSFVNEKGVGRVGRVYRHSEGYYLGVIDGHGAQARGKSMEEAFVAVVEKHLGERQEPRRSLGSKRVGKPIGPPPNPRHRPSQEEQPLMRRTADFASLARNWPGKAYGA